VDKRLPSRPGNLRNNKIAASEEDKAHKNEKAENYYPMQISIENLAFIPFLPMCIIKLKTN
jgi:hypothetical protein